MAFDTSMKTSAQSVEAPAMSDDPHSRSTIFLIDDDAKIRTTLSRALGRRGFKVRAFESALHFLNEYDRTQPGCLVLDYGLPEVNGLELQSILADKNIAIPIIFISGHGGVPETVQAMKAGAIDFLEKPFRQHILIGCIETAMAKDRAARAQEDTRNSALQNFAKLTTREKEIATFMITNPSDTASKEIGRQLEISPRTVDHHRARILEKMEIKSVAELITMSLPTS
jgi:FixJ family two-component response regulator